MIREFQEIFSEGRERSTSNRYHRLLFLVLRGICNINHLDEEHTHRISIDLDDNAGVIDLFVTISGITPMMEGMNESDTASNMTIDVIPSKLTEEDVKYYVSLKVIRLIDRDDQSLLCRVCSRLYARSIRCMTWEKWK